MGCVNGQSGFGFVFGWSAVVVAVVVRELVSSKKKKKNCFRKDIKKLHDKYCIFRVHFFAGSIDTVFFGNGTRRQNSRPVPTGCDTILA